jgi:hypothetical protein
MDQNVIDWLVVIDLILGGIALVIFIVRSLR